MHIGILTGGGDCPGMTAVIRAVTLALVHQHGARVSGIRRGFLGLLTREVLALDVPMVAGILAQGGTLLGTHNRCDPFHYFGASGTDVSGQALAYAAKLGLDALVAIGGDGTMAIAHKLSLMGLPVVGVPKTIDNDLCHTDRSFGFDSAVAVVADALGRLETTARSHGRVMIAETMGRYAGWIALEGGMAGAADATLLGHVQRGGAPTRFDRVLATRFGWHAAELVQQGRFGRMVALQGDAVGSVELAKVAGCNRRVPADHALLAVARGMGVSLGG